MNNPGRHVGKRLTGADRSRRTSLVPRHDEGTVYSAPFSIRTPARSRRFGAVGKNVAAEGRRGPVGSSVPTPLGFMQAPYLLGRPTHRSYPSRAQHSRDGRDRHITDQSILAAARGECFCPRHDVLKGFLACKDFPESFRTFSQSLHMPLSNTIPRLPTTTHSCSSIDQRANASCATASLPQSGHTLLISALSRKSAIHVIRKRSAAAEFASRKRTGEPSGMTRS